MKKVILIILVSLCMLLVSTAATTINPPPPPENYPKCQIKIAYTAQKQSGVFEIMQITLDPYGLKIQNLTNNLADDFDPSWSPDGKQIAFVSTRDDGSSIYFMNADGTGVVLLTKDLRNSRSPAWSPISTQIAFVFSDSIQSDIYLIDTDGKNLKRITNNSQWNDYPSWSPDGKKITFVSAVWDKNQKKFLDSDIYTMNVDGTSLRKLTTSSANDYYPAWSPDGKKIAFTSDRMGDDDIFVMNADGSKVQQLTLNSPSDEGMPSWSPDGKFITFYSNRDNHNMELYFMDASGKDWVRLTTSTVQELNSQPAWFPLCN